MTGSVSAGKHRFWRWKTESQSAHSGYLILGKFLGVQGTFRSLLQHHGSKVSILWLSDFFTVQLPQLYMTIGKTIA